MKRGDSLSTKKERAAIVEQNVKKERARIILLIDDPEKNGVVLASAIDNYLEIFEIYQTFYVDWKDKGFKATEKHTNQAGHSNLQKHPLAQQVEVWTEKKMKAMDMLGLTAKHKARINPNDTVPPKVVPREETTEEEEKDELSKHRQKWKRARGGG